MHYPIGTQNEIKQLFLFLSHTNKAEIIPEKNTMNFFNVYQPNV